MRQTLYRIHIGTIGQMRVNADLNGLELEGMRMLKEI